MSNLMLWLPVKTGPKGWGESFLFRKEIDTPFLPRAGDNIFVGLSEDGSEWSVGHEVHHVYWDGDGTVNATMVTFHIDPDDDGWVQRLSVPWRTEQDGDLLALLDRSGWRRR
jgi:hypothetical protein